MLKRIGDFIEKILKTIIIFITNFLPVKVIRDHKGRPFLYRYHLLKWGNDGPGICIHRFTRSDPGRGYHCHPWPYALSFILTGGYEERILNKNTEEGYDVYNRGRFTFNYLDGYKTFHRVMIEEGKDAWTFFMFGSRKKLWGMVGLDGIYRPMSTEIADKDGDWHQYAEKGLGQHAHLDLDGKVLVTVDIVIINKDKVLLIKRGKEPFKDSWAFPGGRIEQKDGNIMNAAYRELKEETSIEDVKLEYIKTIGNDKRDPRGFCLTNIFLGRLDEIPNNVKAGDDAVDYEWFNLNDLPDMAFDHKEILNEIIDF